MLCEACLRFGTGTYHPASLPPCLLPPPPASSVSSCLSRFASRAFFTLRVVHLEAWTTHAKLRPRMLSRNRVQRKLGPLLTLAERRYMLSCARDSTRSGLGSQWT